jgi:hypothetical protein
VLVGELASVRQAILPIVAAAGGVAVPAILYSLVNAGGPGAHGWGIPMATDIAFALGVMALLGDRVPTALKVFLTALAIVDDIAAVFVIALFYTTEISWSALGVAALCLGVLVTMNRLGARSRFQAGHELQAKINRFFDWQRPIASNTVPQRPPGNQFHRDHRFALDLFGRKDIYEVRMTQRCRQPSLAQKPFPRLRLIEHIIENFERHPSAAFDVFRFENTPHSALPQYANNSVTAKALAAKKVLSRLCPRAKTFIHRQV